MKDQIVRPKHFWRTKTPTVIQMESVECGAASLSIMLSHFGKYIPLEELRITCGVSRDGSNALNLLKAAETYDLTGNGYRLELEELYEIDEPVILFWEFNHFLVLEGFCREGVYLNDPAVGPRMVTYEEFDEGFIGIVLAFEPTEDFTPSGAPPSLFQEILERLRCVRQPLIYLFILGFCLLIPSLSLPAFMNIFVNNILIGNILSWKPFFLLGIALAALLYSALTAMQSFYLNRINGKLSIVLSTKFFWHILRLPVSFYSQRYTAEIAYRTNFNNDISSILTGALSTTSINLLFIFIYGAIMFQYDCLIAIAGIAAALLNLGVLFLIQRSRAGSYSRLQQERSKSLGNALSGLNYIETIKATGTESDFFSRFAAFFTKNINAYQEISRGDTLTAAIPPLMQSLAITTLLGIGGWRAMEGKLDIGMLIALQILLLTFLKPVEQFVNLGQLIQNLKIDIARLNDVTQNPIDPSYSNHNTAEQGEIKKLEGHLEFRNVTFGYSPLSPPLLDNLCFTIKPGQRLALVGPTGSGKSTIAKLASGLYQPWSGEILYDGVPLSELSPERRYHSIASVDQDIFLFSGSIKENLTLWDTTIEEELLVQAAKDAHIHEEILSRPSGYDSLLITGGRNFSGGQRQRMEIARSLIHNPSFLIFDEATSALDSEMEKSITDHIRRRGCSCLLIAHRLSTVADCDEILVIVEGEVVQRGTHAELKQQEGLYQELVNSEV